MTSSLSLRGISKAYAAPMLKNIDIEFRPGEVHALMGANGAGKSTLCQIIAGLVRTDAGEMHYQGLDYRPTSSREAESRGVQIMMQELNLVDELSIAENVHLGHMPAAYGKLDKCLACKGPRSPVCGNDGKTYPSACIAMNCRQLSSEDFTPGACHKKVSIKLGISMLGTGGREGGSILTACLGKCMQ